MQAENQALYLMSKVDEIEGKEIIKIYEAMGYTPQSIRNIISKLKKDNYIMSISRARYKVTKTGKEYIDTHLRRKNFYDYKWDNKWYMVLLEIPETQRKKRDAFRRSLIHLGFGQLYKSVYVYPWNRTKDVISIVDTLEIEEYVTILATDEFILNNIRHEGSNGTNQASEIWDLKAINERYKEMLDLFQAQIAPEISNLISENSQDYLQLFAYYLQVNDIKSELLEKDPMLPPEFLPQNWVGTNVLSTLTNASEKIKNLIPSSSVYFPFL